MEGDSLKAGYVCLVGAGPGDPGLITVRGLERLRAADTILYDALAAPRLLEEVRAGAELIYVGKRGGGHALAQEEINALLVQRARAGRTVVRLKGGDPFIFGRGGEEALALAEAGIPFEVVPGVTAGIAAPAYAGIPLTHRGHTSAVAFVTGHEDPSKPESALDWSRLATGAGTLVIYMGAGQIGPLAETLQRHGRSGDSLAAVVAEGTTPRQRTVVGPLAEIAARAERAGVSPPALIVIGTVVGLREALNWFEARPLFGRRLLVGRPRRQAREVIEGLEALGAEAIALPLIRIVPLEEGAALDVALGNLSTYRWVVFTSANGVEAFLGGLRARGRDLRALGGARLAAIGPATARRLGGEGLAADLVPARYHSAALAEAFKGQVRSGDRVLCARAETASPLLSEALRALGARVDDIAVYRTVAEEGAASRLRELLAAGEVDGVTLTSASTVRAFVAAAGDAARSGEAGACALFSIGPETTREVLAQGLSVAAEAKEQTAAGLVRAIADYYLCGEKAAP